MDEKQAKVEQPDGVKFEVVDDVVTPGAKAVEQDDKGGKAPVTPVVDGKTVNEGGDKAPAEKISKLKESKMAFAKNLIELAKTSTVAQEKVKEMIESDVGTSDYLKTKFPDTYASIITGKKVEEKVEANDINLAEIEEKARVKAKLELYKEQLDAANVSAMKAKAVELGFTSEEYAVFESNVNALGIDRLEDAALLVNRDKFIAQSNTAYNPISSGTQAPAPNVETVKFSRKFAEMAEASGQDLTALAAQKRRFDKMSDGNTLILEGLND